MAHEMNARIYTVNVDSHGAPTEIRIGNTNVEIPADQAPVKHSRDAAFVVIASMPTTEERIRCELVDSTQLTSLHENSAGGPKVYRVMFDMREYLRHEAITEATSDRP